MLAPLESQYRTSLTHRGGQREADHEEGREHGTSNLNYGDRQHEVTLKEPRTKILLFALKDAKPECPVSPTL